MRSQRVWPGLDDKRLTSWNALMISALAEAGAVLERDDYLDGGSAAPSSCWARCATTTAACCAPARTARGRLNAYLEDHAFLLEALLTLYESSFDPRWFGEARALADTMIERFADDEHGGFFETSSDHERLLARRKDLEDHPIPSGNSSAAYGLLRLAALTGEHDYEERAVGVLRLLHELAPRHPQAFGHLLQALDFHLSPVKEVALVGESHELERVVRGAFRPHLVLAGGAPDGVPLLRGPADRRRPRRRLRLRALRLQGARDRAGGARTAALLAILGFALAPPSAHDLAVRISEWGPRPAAERGRGAGAPADRARLPRAPACAWRSRSFACRAAAARAT